MRDLKEEQKEVFYAIKSFINKLGYSPSVRELCEMTGRRSPGTIHYHLKKLKELGYINYNEKQNRTIRIIRKG